MQTSDLDYHLPANLIATHPADPRDHSRLMIYHRNSQKIEHRHFHNLPEYLNPDDLLVLNNTRVLPAKLELAKSTGGKIPGLFIQEIPPPSPQAPDGNPGLSRFIHPHPLTWKIMLRSRGRLQPGESLHAGSYLFRLAEKLPEKGHWLAEISPPDPTAKILAAIGHTPLPPYIERRRKSAGQSEEQSSDRSRYQTVYANTGQSLAAPTAGLHFTDALLQQLAAKGVHQAAIELTVGLGTFLPVETDTLEAHPMHAESYTIPAQTIQAIRKARAEKSRIIAVGTTVVRTLESAAPEILAANPSNPTAYSNTTALKILPGFHFQLTNALLTNFHLPKSTLLALVAALIGLDQLKQIYQLAIEKNYRFYSYGDAMLIL